MGWFLGPPPAHPSGLEVEGAMVVFVIFAAIVLGIITYAILKGRKK